jgi:hypothetical protein
MGLFLRKVAYKLYDVPRPVELIGFVNINLSYCHAKPCSKEAMIFSNLSLDKRSASFSRHFILLFPKATRGLEPISYRGALLSTLLHATVYDYTQFADCADTD